jgi:hypothetical protein
MVLDCPNYLHSHSTMAASTLFVIFTFIMPSAVVVVNATFTGTSRIIFVVA